MTITSRYTTVAPTPQATTASYVIVAGSLMNTLNRNSLSYTIQNTGDESIDWEVIAGNLSDLSDGVVVNSEATIAASAYGTPYAVTATPYAWYAVYIKDTSGGSHGEATINGISKV